MKNRPYILLITIILLITLVILSLVEIPKIIQNIVYFVFGIAGAYFIFNYYFASMSDEEKKNWNIKFNLNKKKKEE